MDLSGILPENFEVKLEHKLDVQSVAVSTVVVVTGVIIGYLVKKALKV